jgi:dihydroneopterin aldolase
VIRARIALAGIVAEGRHGANPGERDETQEFLVDLDIVVNVDSDSLDHTLDYRAAADTARDVVAGTSFELLESLAHAIGRSIYAFEPVASVAVVVHKPHAADSLGLEDVSVEVIVGP